MKKTIAILLGLLLALPETVQAYEIDTHAFITSQAYDRATLKMRH